MKTAEELYSERLNRIKVAITLQKNDRPPFSMNSSAFCVKYAGGKLSDMVTNVEYGNSLILKAVKSLGVVDCIQGGADFPPMMGTVYLSPTKLPGRELPCDTLWQIDEKGLMTEEDYDTIIDKGWNYFSQKFIKERLGNLYKDIEYFMPIAPKLNKKIVDEGYPILTEAVALPPFETISGARSISKFMRDLYRMPDKVQAALDVILEDTLESLRQQIREVKPLTVFVGAARAAGDFLSLKLFDRFMWPYLKKIVEVVVDEGSFAYLHLDMCWDRFLDYFLELPKAKCIFSPDSTTDIFKAKKVLDGHMCIMGDVSPSLLTLGTPDDVHAYCMRLMKEIGPDGFIMAAGCMLPANAKVENVKAMLSATCGK
ncbi:MULTISPECIES: uroporphyrinogen decarboxylase family protein [Clostridium]|uniref:Uroporphyrinogen-III decarboxylase n=5 Tax=Clostridium TaxID=1485 RepID=A0A3M0SLD9_9CLOT|nr:MULTISPECIES: uroporphyrinogen decarboxylase family protein [Clostridium]ADK15119.1 putative Uroporphyrinogen-III decarboxylase-like protein [Clostridium ljungdahlii DSM 13528]AGY74375.1 uroporphyrinogen-III decarboxylase [Clostridium autoethanogenum DSM 10061]ALU34564.1 Uroporphyrinogen decarboxylase (URO-D) [Clostridium autoethanogenum DSM 10061]OAA83768.1 Uroporphyrinogen decarboxylase [Clostridium ljungdahlii DSM 13528]OVY51284.1 Uroporphyrinogen decarboxylase [Clostridium autoethanogen